MSRYLELDYKGRYDQRVFDRLVVEVRQYRDARPETMDRDFWVNEVLLGVIAHERQYPQPIEKRKAVPTLF